MYLLRYLPTYLIRWCLPYKWYILEVYTSIYWHGSACVCNKERETIMGQWRNCLLAVSVICEFFSSGVLVWIVSSFCFLRNAHWVLVWIVSSFLFSKNVDSDVLWIVSSFLFLGMFTELCVYMWIMSSLFFKEYSPGVVTVWIGEFFVFLRGGLHGDISYLVWAFAIMWVGSIDLVQDELLDLGFSWDVLMIIWGDALEVDSSIYLSTSSYVLITIFWCETLEVGT
jgi:hypothetical protein